MLKVLNLFLLLGVLHHRHPQFFVGIRDSFKLLHVIFEQEFVLLLELFHLFLKLLHLQLVHLFVVTTQNRVLLVGLVVALHVFVLRVIALYVLVFEHADKLRKHFPHQL